MLTTWKIPLTFLCTAALSSFSLFEVIEAVQSPWDYDTHPIITVLSRKLHHNKRAVTLSDGVCTLEDSKPAGAMVCIARLWYLNYLLKLFYCKWLVFAFHRYIFPEFHHGKLFIMALKNSKVFAREVVTIFLVRSPWVVILLLQTTLSTQTAVTIVQQIPEQAFKALGLSLRAWSAP